MRVLESAGYIKTKARGSDYTFRELVLLRMVSALKAAHLSTRTINRALRELQPWMDEEYSTSRIALNATAEGIRVRDGLTLWEPSTGQYTLPLQAVQFESQVVPMMTHDQLMKNRQDAAHAHYLRGSALEEEDPMGARAAYESCLAGDCGHLQARINLGRLLHAAGLLCEAEAIYRAHEEPNAILFFNWAVLLEDMKRDWDAIDTYRQALVNDPGFADAHFNLSLLHDRLGRPQASFRHLLAYRRLERRYTPTAVEESDRGV